jgi:endonuclease III
MKKMPNPQRQKKNKKKKRTSGHSVAERTLGERRQRFLALDSALKQLFPHTSIALLHESPWELLVAVMLSAQCTDKKVNEVTRLLFKKYQTLEAYCDASPQEFERDIHQTGFYRTKTKHVLATAQLIRDEYGGEVPCSMEALLSLPGVARKTANIILGTVCGVVEGIAVDTHVQRFAIRFNLTDHINPVHIEQDLMQVIPKHSWYEVTYRIIEYGRQIAPARPYDISKDPLIALYPPAGRIFRVPRT